MFLTCATASYSTSTPLVQRDSCQSLRYMKVSIRKVDIGARCRFEPAASLVGWRSPTEIKRGVSTARGIPHLRSGSYVFALLGASLAARYAFQTRSRCGAHAA